MRITFALCCLAILAIPGQVSAQNVEQGRAILEGKGACLTCHRIRETGSRAAPDLSAIGAALSAEAVTKVLVDPNAALRPAVRSVRVVTQDGKEIIGRRLNEDMYSVQFIDETGELRSMDKSRLRAFSILTAARMPSYKDKLTESELADLVAYLRSLK